MKFHKTLNWIEIAKEVKIEKRKNSVIVTI